MTSIAPGYVEKVAENRMVKPLLIKDLKNADSADYLKKYLSDERIVPFAKIVKGEKRDVLCYAVPDGLMSEDAVISKSKFPFRQVRSYPRTAAEAAALRQCALQIYGLNDDSGEEIVFYIVPSDKEPLFTDIEEDLERAKLHALNRITDAIKELGSLMSSR